MVYAAMCISLQHNNSMNTVKTLMIIVIICHHHFIVSSTKIKTIQCYVRSIKCSHWLRKNGILQPLEGAVIAHLPYHR